MGSKSDSCIGLFGLWGSLVILVEKNSETVMVLKQGLLAENKGPNGD